MAPASLSTSWSAQTGCIQVRDLIFGPQAQFERRLATSLPLPWAGISRETTWLWCRTLPGRARRGC
jgi:hypothetical protein